MLSLRAGRAIVTMALVLGGLFVMQADRAMAQGTADIVGTVTDNTGSIVPMAKVTVKNLDTNLMRTQQTDASGQYSFTLLPIGTYSVTIEAKGFKIYTNPRLGLETGDRARVDGSLQVGDVTQTVEVTGQVTGVQTDSSSVGVLLTNPADLPTNGRNFVTLVQLAPGTTQSTQNSLGGGSRPDDRRQTSAISANGQTDSANNFMLDGMDDNERAIATVIVKPSIDALQEVKVDTSLYPAESGRAGGAVINLITKSGTNNFHGTLFEFLRNDVTDAKNFFNVPQAGNPLAGVRPEYRQNQFGGSVGGPIKKDKLFFFLDYEGFRKIQGQTYQATIPSACELGRIACNGVQQLGNMSDQSAQIYDPVSHVAYANNIIPLSSINSVAANYAALFPTLNCGQPTCLFVSSPNQTQFAHVADGRIDERFSDKDNFFGRYSINNTDTFSPGYLPAATVAGVTIPEPSSLNTSFFPGPAYQRQQALSFSDVHIFSPTMVLQLGAQLARYVTISTSANQGVNGNTAFGGPANVNVPSNPFTGGLALMNFQNGGFADLGDGFALPTAYWDTNYQYGGSLTWTHGTHTVKLGASLLRRDWSTYQILFKQEFNINSAQTSSTGSSTGTGGNALASLLTGYYASSVRNMGLVAPQYRDWEIGDYIQDNWRATRWLTINAGLRWDIYTPITEKNNALSNFDPTNAAELASGMIQVAGAQGVSSSVNIGTQWGDVQPRLGFAATLGHNMVLRGGFGMSYWPNNVASPANLKNAPMVSNYTINQLAQPSLTISQPTPLVVPNATCLVAACGASTSSPGYTPSGFSVGSGTQVPYHNTTIYMTNLTLEKEIWGNIVSVGFVAEPVRNLGRVVPNVATNLPPLGPGGCGVTTTVGFGSPCLPYASTLPLVGTIQLLETNGVANYTALQVIVQRRYKSGLTVSGNYTYSSDLSDVGGTGGACTGCAQVLNNFGRDYGPSDFMSKNRFNAAVSYELPFGKSSHGAAAQIVKGWAINGIYFYATGQPFTVLDGSAQQNSFGVTTDRPNTVTGQGFTQSINEWMDITQFAKQPFGTVGTEGHNDFTMPHTTRVDLSIYKDFAIREGMKLQFRAESFNLTNTPSFAMPGTTISGFTSAGVPTNAGNFGKITAMNIFYTPRDIQFALKLIF